MIVLITVTRQRCRRARVCVPGYARAVGGLRRTFIGRPSEPRDSFFLSQRWRQLKDLGQLSASDLRAPAALGTPQSYCSSIRSPLAGQYVRSPRVSATAVSLALAMCSPLQILELQASTLVGGSHAMASGSGKGLPDHSRSRPGRGRARHAPWFGSTRMHGVVRREDLPPCKLGWCCHQARTRARVTFAS